MPDANPEPAQGPVQLGLGELRRAVREQAGLDVVSLVPAGGESGAAFWLRERDGAAWLLKVTREPVSGLQALDAMTGRLRARGYPAPRLRAIGQLGGGLAAPDHHHPAGRRRWLLPAFHDGGQTGYPGHAGRRARDRRDLQLRDPARS